MDNATWHKTNKVKIFCNENNITLFFLPPYSPEYNPIERVWSYLKSKVRQKYFATANAFREFIFNLMSKVEVLGSICSSLI